MDSRTMHDSVEQLAATAHQDRPSSGSMFTFNQPFLPSNESVDAKREPPGYSYQSAVGLGPIHGLPTAHPIPVHEWQAQHIPETTACYDTAVSAPDYNGLSTYYTSPYATSTLADAATIQYPIFTSSAQTQPFYYSPAYSASQNGSPGFGQASTRGWPLTPQSHFSSPEEVFKQNPHRTSPTENVWPSPTTSNKDSQDRQLIAYEKSSRSSSKEQSNVFEGPPSPHDTESTSGSDTRQGSLDGSVSPRPSTKGTKKSSKKTSITLEDGQSDPAMDFRCETCGRKFTRRSNCLEHSKKHNPENRKLHICKMCNKGFGRKTDLKRHYSTKMHDGEKKFACNECGRYYSRLDTLHRHRKDCCSERRRQAATAAKQIQAPVVAYQYYGYSPF